MAKKTLQELLAESKDLRRKELELKAQRKAQKAVMATEYCDGLSAEEKNKQISEAEKILNAASQGLLKARAELKYGITLLRADFNKKAMSIRAGAEIAKETLDFVNYKQKNSLAKRENSTVIDGNFVVFNRVGIKEIRIDHTKINWEKEYKEALKLQGLNGDNRIAANLIYQAQLLVKAKNTDTSIVK